jgi:glycerol-1-phosphatase
VLQSSDEPLWDAYDVALLDLDGVVYIGPVAVPGAAEHLTKAAAAGMRLAYVTNNASRTPSLVARHLRELGVDADPGDVVTSAQAAATLLADRLPPGSSVFVIGGPGLFSALEERGLHPVQTLGEDADAVVSGYSAEVTWRVVSEGAILVRSGLPWVASNTDLTMPSAHGLAPGNGALVELVASFSGRRPVVAGKPQPPLFEETMRRVGGSRPLVVGDRLDTDIEGGRAAGLATLLVLTGVSGAAELLAAPPQLRPDYVAPDLSALHADAAGLAPGPRPGWTARVSGPGTCVLAGSGDAVDALRALCAVHWASGGGPVTVTADGAGAATALRELGLDAGADGSGGGSATVAAAASPPGEHR